MMGDPGTSHPTVQPESSLAIQRRDEFQGQPLPIFSLGTSVPSSSSYRHPQPPLIWQLSADDHPAVSSRRDGHDEWSNGASQSASGPATGHHHWSEDQTPLVGWPKEQGRSWDSGDTRARVGEDDLLTFPEGEDGAVTITASDFAGLQPSKFVSDNTVDFYIKYLSVTVLSLENRERFHFFNSFFFTKLLEHTASTDIDTFRVDYEQLRKWTGAVNLFEKDYVFIPVIKRSHWSLIVMCYLSSLNPSSPDEKKGSPCMLHLDPIKGKDENIEGQVRSYIFQAWMERFQASDNMDLLHSLVQMKYIEAEVPQQGNCYDCGLYVLHYIEEFLRKSTSQDLRFSSSEAGAHFTGPNFEEEIFGKRMRIRNLILELRGALQQRVGRRLDIQPKPQQRALVVHRPRPQPKGLPKPPKESKSKKWKEKETSILLQCMVDGGRFCKGNQGAMDWDLISREINKVNNKGPTRSKEQCQNRFDTLLKAYKDLNAYCEETGKEFVEVADEEKRKLKLATPLKKEDEGWYNHLRDIIHRRRLALEAYSRKRVKLNPGGDSDTGALPSSPRNLSPRSPAPPSAIAVCESEERCRKQVAIPGFKALNEEVRSTLLNLIQACSMQTWWRRGYNMEADEEEVVCILGEVCRRLAIVQDQKQVEVLQHVLELWKLDLVNMVDLDEFEAIPWDIKQSDHLMEKKVLKRRDIQVYKKFAKKVLSKNLYWNTFRRISRNEMFATELFPLQEIRVLSLYKCQELLYVNLGDFPDLRCLDIKRCNKLKVIRGWEVVKELGWVDIRECDCYGDFPNVRHLSFLREFHFGSYKMSTIPWNLCDFSQCVQLDRLGILDCKHSLESMDLKALKFLEVLSFEGCSALSTIQGLSGLHALTQLNLSSCDNLRRVPELGCLKALTHLDLSYSGIEEIPGVEELHSLTLVNLFFCKSLKELPFLGHLKALAYLGFSCSGVEEIRGVEDLVSLEWLICVDSQLKWLPNLQHLPRLRGVEVGGTPLTTSDPSSSSYGKDRLYCNGKEEGKVLVDEISDISDTEYIPSDADLDFSD